MKLPRTIECPHCNSEMVPVPDSDHSKWMYAWCRFDWKLSDGGCGACGKPCTGAYGIPMFEGRVLSNHWLGEWFGRDACRECYEAQQRLPEETDNPKELEWVI